MSSQNLLQLLRDNAYPGRGILLGRSPDGERAVLAYFIMGRSENSRNRVFAPTPDGIQTQAADPGKVSDPSLIFYHPVRRVEGKTIVTNGDQTDTIRDALLAGHCYRHGLNTRSFEPDAPHYTPRISGVLRPDGGCCLSILKTLDGNPEVCCRQYFEYDCPPPGLGHFIHTYEGDGSPLPSFAGEPRLVTIDANAPDGLADAIWESLNRDNRVALYVELTCLADGSRQTALRQRHRLDARPE